MFSNIDYDSTMLVNYLKYYFNKLDDLNLFLDFINKDYISISGSSILQIIQNKLYTTDGQYTDIDIYIEINNLTEEKFQHIQNLTQFLCDFISITPRVKDIYLNDLNKLKHIQYTTNNFAKYNSLSKYIKLYHLYKNVHYNKNFKIEIIYIKCHIEHLLLNSFDYDIVKNYWKQYKIYSFNYFAISNKVATMTLKHFIQRIMLGSKKEFTNFLTRFFKYNNRGFTIFIHKTNITKHIINHIIMIKYITNSPQITFNNGKLISYNDFNYNYTYRLYYTLKNSNNQLSKQINHREILYNYNNNLTILSFYIESYIINYILTAGIVQKKILYNKLKNYSNYLLEEYLHPDSAYMMYKGLKWKVNNKNNDNDNKRQLCYINKDNQIIVFNLK